MCTKRFAVSVLFSVLFFGYYASAASKKPMVLVVLNDGSTIEGRFNYESKTVYRVSAGYKTHSLKKTDIKTIYNLSASTRVRFKVKRKVNDLMLLYARQGIVAEEHLCREHIEKINKAEDPIKAAEEYIKANKLLPSRIEKVVNKNREAFKKKYGSSVVEIETDNYYILSTCDKKYVNYIAKRMGSIFKLYQRQFNFTEKIEYKFVIKVFSSASEYYASGGPRGSVAYYYPALMELVAYREDKVTTTLSNLYHEGLHQFLSFYVAKPPIWLNEGLAMYYQEARPTGGGHKLGGINKELVKFLVYKKEYLPDVKRMITQSQAEFYSASFANYSMAWALTHFFIKGRSAKMKEIYIDYIKALRAGSTQAEANREVFGQLDMKKLQKNVKDHISRLNR